MTQAIFITATDTDAGKTTITLEYLARYAALGAKTVALKPVACGAHVQQDQFVNEDALKLQAASTLKKSYQQINPFLFTTPCSPNIAAAKQQQTISVTDLLNAYESAMQWHADYLLIEGAGGWYVPLNEQETLADFVKALHIPVILVVAIKLGCINHAILTMKAILDDGVECLGWVANLCVEEFAEFEENIATLQQYLPRPLLMIQNFNK